VAKGLLGTPQPFHGRTALLSADAGARPVMIVAGDAAAVGFGSLAFRLHADLFEFFDGLFEAEPQSFRFGDEFLTLSGKVVYFVRGHVGYLSIDSKDRVWHDARAIAIGAMNRTRILRPL
jgi:hypothetical protein